MATHIFLDLQYVLRIHGSLITAYGGANGVREPGLLNSAVAMPQATFEGQYLHAGIFEMAAAYMFHIVQNHPFIDGNKRTGAATAIIFLALNDLEIEADEDGLVDLTLSVASGKAGKTEIAEFFRARAHPIPTEPES
ncbi:MAG: type II toxin-antitoxin system death-on-curing family toxin [Planctomycetes bacterium]|nr:type II toxin-antitoxin system death-on-curing family toxin [Planctomycetota bacterium]